MNMSIRSVKNICITRKIDLKCIDIVELLKGAERYILLHNGIK